MNDLNKAIFKIENQVIKQSDNGHPNINFVFSLLEISNIEDLNSEQNELIDYKNKIEELENPQNWDTAKKFCNKYELIYLPNKKYKLDSISKYEPLSRSYFKLLEIIVDFDLLSTRRNLEIGCLAEGPGGFIEAIVNYRKRVGSYNDIINAITLKSSNNDIPGWTKSANFLRKNSNVRICYGKDDTGNIYNVKNIKFFSLNFRNSADLVTADGGFDFSYNFNKQEYLSCRIIFCEIVTALSIQRKGGSFVCKFFDIYNEITKSFIYLLKSCYENVYITKPNTSRPANSEKYVICKQFNGINEIYLQKLYILINNWEYIETNSLFINKIFDIDIDFIKKIDEINNKYFNIQIKNIKNTLEFIENNTETIENNTETIENNNETIENNTETIEPLFNNNTFNQTILAYKWCKYYKVSINYGSKYIKYYKNYL